MTTPTTRAITATLAALALSACGTAAGEAPSASVATPSSTQTSAWAAGVDLPTVDRSDPEAVSKAFAELLLSYDTTRDTGPLDAAARASRLATDELAAELLAPERAAGNGWWWEAAEHDASARVRIDTVTDEGRPDNTAGTSYGLWSVRWWMAGTDGWTGDVTEQVVYVTIDAGPEGWLVSQASAR